MQNGELVSTFVFFGLIAIAALVVWGILAAEAREMRAIRCRWNNKHCPHGKKNHE
jgi:hypothetical protein